MNPENPTLFQQSLTLTHGNAMLQKALQKLPADVRPDLVLRCDDLPLLYIPASNLESILVSLLHTIISNKGAGNKRYLHIDCKKELKKEIVTTDIRGLSMYQIRFHTNLNGCKDWQSDNAKSLATVTETVRQFGGHLSVNYLDNRGCFFILSLPGKL